MISLRVFVQTCEKQTFHSKQIQLIDLLDACVYKTAADHRPNAVDYWSIIQLLRLQGKNQQEYKASQTQ